MFFEERAYRTEGDRNGTGRGAAGLANYTYGVRAVCPFYIKEAKLSITCEGLAAGTEVMTRFATREEKRRYQRANCERYTFAELCPLAAALQQKYAD